MTPKTVVEELIEEIANKDLSLELSRQGYSREGNHYWIYRPILLKSGFDWGWFSITKDKMLELYSNRVREDAIIAPTLKELRDIFPKNVQPPFKLESGMWCWSNPEGRHPVYTEVDAMASQLVYLAENCFINL